MIRSIEDYMEIAGLRKISEIYNKAQRLYDKHVCRINPAFLGGETEILGRLVPLMNEAGPDADWRIIHGNPACSDAA